MKKTLNSLLLLLIGSGVVLLLNACRKTEEPVPRELQIEFLEDYEGYVPSIDVLYLNCGFEIATRVTVGESELDTYDVLLKKQGSQGDGISIYGDPVSFTSEEKAYQGKFIKFFDVTNIYDQIATETGAYVLTVTITDKDGQTATIEKEVTISDPTLSAYFIDIDGPERDTYITKNTTLPAGEEFTIVLRAFCTPEPLNNIKKVKILLNGVEDPKLSQNYSQEDFKSIRLYTGIVQDGNPPSYTPLTAPDTPGKSDQYGFIVVDDKDNESEPLYITVTAK